MRGQWLDCGRQEEVNSHHTLISIENSKKRSNVVQRICVLQKPICADPSVACGAPKAVVHLRDGPCSLAKFILSLSDGC